MSRLWTREEVVALLDKHIYAEAESEGVSWVKVWGIEEAADAILLRDLRDNVGGCPECPACQDRALRVATAIAALEARPATEGAH